MQPEGQVVGLYSDEEVAWEFVTFDPHEVNRCFV